VQTFSKTLEPNYNHMKTHVFNTSTIFDLQPVVPRCLTAGHPASITSILQMEATLINTPFGQIEYQSRRRGSFLEFAFAKNNVMLSEHAVSGDGPNLQGWNEFVARYHQLRKLKAVHGCSIVTLPAPEQGPWLAQFMLMGAGTLTEPEVVSLGHLQLGVATGFIQQFTGTTSNR
jgi:hypothetical protein